MRTNFRCLMFVWVVVCFASCGANKHTENNTGDSEPAATSESNSPPDSFAILSSVFAEGEEIPTKYTCEGANVSPPLNWTGIPEGTKSLALIVDDPDAPDPARPQMTWVHWVLYNMPALEGGFEEKAERLPPGAQNGLNDWKKTGYGGPCPPIGRHRYFFKLYALDTTLEGLETPTKAEIEKAMTNRILGRAQLIGTYEKKVK